MNIVYNHIKTLVPKQVFTKKRDEGEFLVLLSPSLELLFFNDVAKEFYDKINSNRTLEDIVKLMLDEYEVLEDVLVVDVVTIVRDFQWKGILTLSE